MSATSFDSPLGAFQLTQAKLADMTLELSKGMLLALHLGRLKDAADSAPEQVSLGKLNNVREAIAIARECRTILGAAGITLEYPVMRHANNLESVLTYEGTSEVHQLVIGQALTGESAFRVSDQPLPPTRWEGPPDVGRGYGGHFAELIAGGADVEGEARLADALAPRGARILDAGSGMGRIGAALRRAGHQAVGVDLDEGLIEQSRATYPDLPVAQARLEALDAGVPRDARHCRPSTTSSSASAT